MGKHIVSTKRLSDYQKMLNQWDSTGIKYDILYEWLFQQMDIPMIAYHIKRYS